MVKNDDFLGVIPRSILSGLIVWAFVALPSPGFAQPEPEALFRGRRLIQKELRYQEGIAVLEAALQSGALDASARAKAYALLGVAYVARGAPKSAEAAFGELLKLNPSHRLDPLLSPKIHEIFERALQQRAPKILDVHAKVQKRSIAFMARLEDPADRIARVELRAKDASGVYRTTEMAREAQRLQAVLLIPSTGKGRVEYHLVGLDAQRRPLTSAGTAQTPLSVVYQRAEIATQVAVTQPTATPWYGRWWVWAIAGTLVAGGVTTAVLLTREQAPPPAGTLEPIQLDLQIR